MTPERKREIERRRQQARRLRERNRESKGRR
jgi:hypothetical protein